MKKFLIIGTIRSGSSLVASQIGSHPEVAMPADEIKLAKVLIEPLEHFTFGANKGFEKVRAPKLFFRALCNLNASHETRASGFKSAINDLSHWDACLEILRESFRDVVIISTIREDLIALIGSAAHASKSQIWHTCSKPEKEVVQQIYIDPLDFSEKYFHYRKIIADIRSLMTSHCYYEVSYERDVIERKNYLRPIFNALELSDFPEAKNSSPLKKIVPHPSEYIVNYDQLVSLEKYLLQTGKRLKHTPMRRIDRLLSRKLGFHLRSVNTHF